MIWHRVFYNFFGTEIHKRLGAIHKRFGAIYKRLGAIYKKLGAIYKKLGAKILAPKLYTPVFDRLSLSSTFPRLYGRFLELEIPYFANCHVIIG